MSASPTITVLNAACASSLTATERHVLIVWGGYLGNRSGWVAWPSVAALVEASGLGRRTVLRVLSSLRSQGILEVVGSTPSGVRKMRLHLEHIPGGATTAPQTDPQETPEGCHNGTPRDDLRGATVARGGCHSGTGGVPQWHTEGPSEGPSEVVAPPNPLTCGEGELNDIVLTRVARESLRAAGITSLGDLAEQATQSGLRRLPGIGRKTALRLAQAVESAGLNLQPEPRRL